MHADATREIYLESNELLNILPSKVISYVPIESSRLIWKLHLASFYFRLFYRSLDWPGLVEA